MKQNNPDNVGVCESSLGIIVVMEFETIISSLSYYEHNFAIETVLL